jgi:hypothetical protein
MYPQVRKLKTIMQLLFLISNVVFADVIGVRVQNFHENFGSSDWRLKNPIVAEILDAVKEVMRSYPKIKIGVC